MAYTDCGLLFEASMASAMMSAIVLRIEILWRKWSASPGQSGKTPKPVF